MIKMLFIVAIYLFLGYLFSLFCESVGAYESCEKPSWLMPFAIILTMLVWPILFVITVFVGIVAFVQNCIEVFKKD